MSSDAFHSAFSGADILAQLERICSSPVFARAAAVQQLLRFLVQEAVSGAETLSRAGVYTKLGNQPSDLRKRKRSASTKSEFSNALISITPRLLLPM
jgi:hypothetical protein